MNWQTNGGKTVFVWPFSRGLPHSIFGSWSVSIFWMMRNFHSRSFLIVWSGRIAIFPLINGKTSYCISSQTNPTEHFFLLFVVSFFFAASVKKTKLIANTRKKNRKTRLDTQHNKKIKSNETKWNVCSPWTNNAKILLFRIFTQSLTSFFSSSHISFSRVCAHSHPNVSHAIHFAFIPSTTGTAVW